MTISEIVAARWRSGVFLLLAPAPFGCDSENATITTPPEAAKLDLSRPFGDAAPAAKRPKAAKTQEVFVPKNPKLRN
jgi:hypothetical protein